MENFEQIQRLLDVNMSAELLRVSPYTIRSWISQRGHEIGSTREDRAG